MINHCDILIFDFVEEKLQLLHNFEFSSRIFQKATSEKVNKFYELNIIKFEGKILQKRINRYCKSPFVYF